MTAFYKLFVPTAILLPNNKGLIFLGRGTKKIGLALEIIPIMNQ